MASYAILDASGVWQNTIEWDGITPFNPPSGSTLEPLSSLPAGGIAGATLLNGAWTPPSAPPPQTIGLTYLQFMALFKTSEQDAIVNSTDTQVRLFNLMAAGSGSIDLTNPEFVSGVGYLASLSLIALSRVAVILAGKAA